MHPQSTALPSIVPTEKRCSTCHAIKAPTQFCRNRTQPDGLNNVCRMCAKEYDRRQREKLPPDELPTEKTCRRCGQTKPIEDFVKRGDRIEMRRSLCKECRYKPRQLSFNVKEAGVLHNGRVVSFSHSFTLKRIDRGLCMWCGTPLDEKTVAAKHRLCPACADRKRGYARERIEDALTTDICLSCGTRPRTSGYRTCAECRELHRVVQRRHLDMKIATRLCFGCGKPPMDMPCKIVFCEKCYCKRLATSALGDRSLWTALYEKMHDQALICPYTGTKLVPGLNLSADHKMPKSRFPHLANDPDNLEWVRLDINRMKRDRTPDEFFALMREVLAYHDALH